MLTRSNRAYWFAPLATLLLLGTVFALAGLYPFGQQTLAWCDMDQQGVPLFMSLKDVLAGRDGLLLNTHNAGGMNFWGVFLYYLCSPFSLAAALVPKAEMWHLMNLLVLCKMVLAALTASILFTKAFPHLNDAMATCLSVLYACCGFSLLFYQNAMWLDAVYLLPLVVQGLRDMYYEEKPTVFILSLTGLVATSFYMGGILLLWLVLFTGLFLCFMGDKARRGRLCLLLGLSVGIVLLLTGPVWLPALQQYGSSGRGRDLLSSLASGSFTGQIPTNLSVLLCTSPLLAAVPLFLLCKDRARPLQALVTVFALMLVPLFIDPINRMWHLGSYQAFPVRYGYILCLMGLLVVAWNWDQSRSRLLPGVPEPATRPCWVVLSAALGLGAAVAACYAYTRHRDMLTRYVQTLWAADGTLALLLPVALLLATAVVVVSMAYRWQEMRTPVFCVLLCLLVGGEVLWNANLYMGASARDGQPYKAMMDLEGKVQDPALYRMKTDKTHFAANFTGGLGYGSLGHYTSLTDGAYEFAMQRLGYSSNWMSVSSNGGTAFSDALLAQKYSIATAGDLRGRRELYRNDSFSVVQQPYCLPFGVMAWQLGEGWQDGDRFAHQEQLYRAVTGSKDRLFARYQPTAQEGAVLTTEEGKTLVKGAGGRLRYEIAVQGKQMLYFDCFGQADTSLAKPQYDAFRVTVNGQPCADAYPNSNEAGILELGTFSNQTVTVELELLHDVDALSFGVAGLDCAKLEQALAAVQPADLQAQGNGFVGTVRAEKAGWLLLPMRGGRGFYAAVNGQRAETAEAFGCFLAVRVPAGQSLHVQVQFVPAGLGWGLLLLLCGVLAFALLQRARRRGLLAKTPAVLHRVALGLFAAIVAAVFALLYVLPVVIYCTSYAVAGF